jgi:DNA-binding transcriptional LysR family regulator
MELENLRIADLRTFLEVRRCGSITGAARALQVTPSQVSKSMVRLEGQLHVQLLSRTSRGVALSSAGRKILPDIESVIAALERLKAGPVESSAPELTMAAPSFLNSLFVPAIAARLPAVRLRALEYPPALVRAFAAEGVFDMALTIGQERLPGSWVSARAGEVRRGLFGSPALARSLGSSVGNEKLRDIPFITPVYSFNGQSVPVDDGCPLGYERKIGNETQTIGVALEMAARTRQLVFGPAIAAHEHVKARRLVEIRVRGWNVSEPLYVACNGERVLARVQQAALDAVAGTLTELAE